MKPFNNKKCRFSPLKIAGFVVGGIALATVVGFVLGYVVMLLWNWLMPAIFGLGLISFWQAVGITILAKLLLSSHPRHTNHPSSKYSHKPFPWRKNTNTKWEHFDEYWEEEGNINFENYISTKNK